MYLFFFLLYILPSTPNKREKYSRRSWELPWSLRTFWDNYLIYRNIVRYVMFPNDTNIYLRNSGEQPHLCCKLTTSDVIVRHPYGRIISSHTSSAVYQWLLLFAYKFCKGFLHDMLREVKQNFNWFHQCLYGYTLLNFFERVISSLPIFRSFSFLKGIPN